MNRKKNRNVPLQIFKTALNGLLFFTVGTLLCACSQSANPKNKDDGVNTDETTESRGARIVAEYLKHDAAPLRKSRVRFTITSENEPAKIYELDVYRKQGSDETLTLTQIVKPVEDGDLATLAIEGREKKTVLVTYASSRDEFRETDTNKMFFGGLTAGELLGEWDKYGYRLVGEKDLGGRKVYEVEGGLKTGMKSVVMRTKVFFRSDNYVPAELHLFDSNRSEIRSYVVTEFKDDPIHPYAARTEVENPVYKAHITIEILSQEFPTTLDDSMFTRERLKQKAQK